VAEADGGAGGGCAGALHNLQMAKMKDKQIDALMGATTKLQAIQSNLEGGSSLKRNIAAMKLGTTTMQKQLEGMNADDVADIMDDFREQMDVQNEITSALTEALPGMEDEDELTAELDKMLEEDMVGEHGIEEAAGGGEHAVETTATEEFGMGELPAVPDGSLLPQVPSRTPATAGRRLAGAAAGAAGGGGGGGGGTAAAAGADDSGLGTLESLMG
jgi:hypothetical protein